MHLSFLNMTLLEMEIGVEAESMHMPRPSQQAALMAPVE